MKQTNWLRPMILLFPCVILCMSGCRSVGNVGEISLYDVVRGHQFEYAIAKDSCTAEGFYPIVGWSADPTLGRALRSVVQSKASGDHTFCGSFVTFLLRPSDSHGSEVVIVELQNMTATFVVSRGQYLSTGGLKRMYEGAYCVRSPDLAKQIISYIKQHVPAIYREKKQNIEGLFNRELSDAEFYLVMVAGVTGPIKVNDTVHVRSPEPKRLK